MGRSDGTKVGNLGVLRRMLPSLMPSRNGSIVYYEQELDLNKTLPWLEARQPSITLYELAIAGLVRVWSPSFPSGSCARWLRFKKWSTGSACFRGS